MSDSHQRVAVLCAGPRSHYHALPGLEVYDVHRDARTFEGGMPIVAHPPCRSWSAFCAQQAKPLDGERDLALWCIQQLRNWGGILEQPAHSRLFDAAQIPKPRAAACEGVWSMQVDQSWWGDKRTKKTWLAFFHIDPAAVHVPFQLHHPSFDRRAWRAMSKNTRSRTPLVMCQWLVATAAKAKAPQIIPERN